MSAELVQALRELEREKGISFETILHGLEEALASAYKSSMRGGEEPEEEELHDVRFTLDPESGDMGAFLQTFDEQGNLVEEQEVPVSEEFKGRIAAQTAKQVILQRIREAEREMMYDEYVDRVTEVGRASCRERVSSVV